MQDPAKDLYDRIATRKNEAGSAHTYEGGNGRVDRAVDLILNEDFPRSGVLVDIGGATGNLGYALRRQFQSRYVVDIAQDCSVPAEAKGNVFYKANIDSVGLCMFDDNSVDLITALDFIEHILDPGNFARECHRILKPGGRVLINTPNIQFWKHMSSLVEYGIFPHTSGDREVYHGGHVAFFTLDDMTKLFSSPPFTDLRQHLRGLTPEACPPIWEGMLKQPKELLLRRQRLCYADLVFSCKKA